MTGHSGRTMPPSPPVDQIRYEVIPCDSALREAREAPTPLTLTVTCSPTHGNDHTVDVACKLRGMGHTVIVHLAARMVRGPEHLEELLTRMASHGIADVFLVGGDATQPAGPYASALELLPALRASRVAPRTIGVAAYPEGHPLIGDEALVDSLRQKNDLADYMTTQLCFDSGALLRWLEGIREAGVSLPLYVGVPGIVERRRLLEISLRVGVGASLSFVRKQRGLRRVLAARVDVTRRLFSAYAPLLGNEFGIAGMHLYTFNALNRTARFVNGQMDEHPATFSPKASPLPHPSFQEC